MANILQSKALLCILGVVGILGTQVGTGLDGSTDHLMKVVDDPEGRLPGSQALLQRTFTGIYPFDHIISILVVFWYEVVDGSHPASTAVALYFLGQLLPCILLIYTNSQRGSKLSLLRPTAWLVIFQVFSLGVAGFIWALTYIVTSSTVLKSRNGASLEVLQRASILSSPSLVKFLLLPAIALGYLVPAVLMGVFSSNAGSTAHQTAIGAWNMYPLLIFPILSGLRIVFPARTSSNESPKRVHLAAIRAAKIPAIIFSFFMHCAIVGISLVTVLFPTVIEPSYLSQLHPSAIFIPPLALTKATTPGSGVKGFLLWDQLVAYLVVMVVVTVELQSVWVVIQRAQPFRWVWYLPVLGLTSLLLGPGTAALMVSWLKDELLFGDGVDDMETKKAVKKL